MTSILVITNMYPPHHYGGYELNCRDVVGRWRSGGHHVSVLTSTIRVPGVEDGPEEDPGVFRELSAYWDDHRLLNPSLRARLRTERANQWRLAQAMTRSRPDVVSVWNMGALSFGLLTAMAERGVPLVHVVEDDWLSFGPRVDPWARLFLGRPRLAGAVRSVVGVPTALADLGATGTFCFVSRALRAQAERESIWRYPDATVVYSGIDRRDFPPASTNGTGAGAGSWAGADAGPWAGPARGGGRPWGWRLLYVGRIDPRKGLDTAIKALALLAPEARLEVIGRGDDRYLAELRRLAAGLGVTERVRYGCRPRAELAGRYRAADVLVFPSTWDEPFGLVPVEAMACATPVVATATGGSGEFLVDEANCLRFPPGDHRAAAAAVERLAADPDLRGRLVRGGLETAVELDVDRLAEVLEEWHVAAASRFASGRPAPRPAPVPGSGPAHR